MKTIDLWHYGLLVADCLFLMLLLFGDQPAFWGGFSRWIRGENQYSYPQGYGMHTRRPIQNVSPFDFDALIENRENVVHNTLTEWREQYYYLKSENGHLRSSRGLHDYWKVIIKLTGLVLLVLHLYCWQSQKSDSPLLFNFQITNIK